MARVLITGCSSGIGQASAVELVRRGHEVVATARRPETIASLDVAKRLQLDVTDEASVAAAVAAAGPIDVLVNNAGISAWGPVELVPIELAGRVMDTNYLGVLRTTKAVLPQMVARGSGRIVNVSSAAGRAVGALIGIYAASKFALEAVSEALRIEVGPLGVAVVLIEPGAVESRFPDNRVMVRPGRGPYRRLVEAGEVSLEASRANLTSSEHVATVVADAVEAQAPRLRWFASDDAEAIVKRRMAMSDGEWEAAALERLGLAPEAG